MPLCAQTIALECLATQRELRLTISRLHPKASANLKREVSLPWSQKLFCCGGERDKLPFRLAIRTMATETRAEPPSIRAGTLLLSRKFCPRMRVLGIRAEPVRISMTSEFGSRTCSSVPACNATDSWNGSLDTPGTTPPMQKYHGWAHGNFLDIPQRYGSGEERQTDACS